MQITSYLSAARVFICSGSLLLILVGCQEYERPDFVNKIPGSDDYEYATIYSWAGVHHDTISVDLWYDGDRSTVVLDRIEDILFTENGTYWVADLTRGMVYEFDDIGEPVREVFRRGRGPGDIGTPVSMYQYRDGEETFIYILDIGLNMVLKTDLEGQEITRYYFRQVPRAFSTNKLTVLNRNEFVWPSFLYNPVLAKRDSNDTLIEGLVEQVIPQGYQPSMHNSVMYEIDEERRLFAWGYHGVPVLMLHKENGRKMVHLNPEEDPEQLNFTLEFLDRFIQPEDGFGTVYNLIREIFFDDVSVWVAYRTSLIRIPFSKDLPVHIYHFTTLDGTSLIYHDLFKTGEELFFVRHHAERVYRLPLHTLQANDL